MMLLRFVFLLLKKDKGIERLSAPVASWPRSWPAEVALVQDPAKDIEKWSRAAHIHTLLYINSIYSVERVVAIC